ncbi:uncharacterized protein [Diabrotica undecimpunctata]|uniref:uncharacterized protein n=1 Tax=Diabrotica undecimpunctata TaxID=50387 RepID=UPI003B63929A
MKLILCFSLLLISFGFVRCLISEYRIGHLLRYCIVVSTPEKLACDGLVSVLDKNKDGHITNAELKSFVLENIPTADQEEFLHRLRLIIFHKDEQYDESLDLQSVSRSEARSKLMRRPHLRDSFK